MTDSRTIEATILALVGHGEAHSITEIARAHYGVEDVTPNQRNAVNRTVHRMAGRGQVVTINGTDEDWMPYTRTTRRVPTYAAPCNGGLGFTSGNLAATMKALGLPPEQAKETCEKCAYGVEWQKDEPEVSEGEWDDDSRSLGAEHGWHVWSPRRQSIPDLFLDETESKGFAPRRALWVWHPDDYAEQVREFANQEPTLLTVDLDAVDEQESEQRDGIRRLFS